MKRVALLALLAVPAPAFAQNAAGAPGGATVSAAQVRRIIEQNETAYGNVMKRGDVAAYGKLFTEDTTVLQGNVIIKGKAKLMESFKGAKPFRDVVFSIQEVDVSGPLAYEVGSYKVTTAAGLVNTGNYLEVWKRQPDGSWKIKVEATVPHVAHK